MEHDRLENEPRDVAALELGSCGARSNSGVEELLE